MHVEDDDTCAYALSCALRELNADVDVFRLCDGEDAVLFLTRAGIFANAPRPDVIVLDLNLPKKNGHEVELVPWAETTSQETGNRSMLNHSFAAGNRFKLSLCETALAMEDSNNGIWRKPITFRNCCSAMSKPEPTQRSI